MDQNQDSSQPFVPKSMGIKVGMLLAFAIAVAVALLAYVLHARGTFADFQRLELVTENAEGVAPGMDLTVAGIPIGRVRRLSLNPDGTASIHIRVPLEHAHRLRTTTQFTLIVGLVGGPKLRAHTSPAHLDDPPLPDRAKRPVSRGDTTDELPRVVANLRNVLENVDQMTDAGSSLDKSFANLRVITERMAGKSGVLAGVLGGEDNAKKLLLTLDRANALLASLNGVSLKLDTVLSKTDQQVLGPGGVVEETQKAIRQANAILTEVGAQLKRVDAILADAQVVASNAKVATTDLGALRAEVEASLRKVGALIDEINRKWPFERDTKVRLP
jgi:phospholipid/cholesterol/gamma-HCH transport system substrate-binding protein